MFFFSINRELGQQILQSTIHAGLQDFLKRPNLHPIFFLFFSSINREMG